MEVQQLRQHRRGVGPAPDLSGLFQKMRILECDLLSTRLRLHGNGQPIEVTRAIFKILLTPCFDFQGKLGLFPLAVGRTNTPETPHANL
jgi:hypothetical protein